MKKSLALALVLIACLAPAAIAEGETHVIASLGFKIAGITTEKALRTFLSIRPPLREGLEFATAEELTAFLEGKRQDLVNDRVFKSVKYSDEAEEASGGAVRHAITFEVVDAFSLFPLPNVTYDSNYGWEPDIETHYDNAFGSMTNLYLDAYFAIRDKDGEADVNKWRIHPKVSNLVIAGLPFTLDMLFDYLKAENYTDDVLVSNYDYYKANADLSTVFNFKNNMYYKPGLVAFSYFDYHDYLGNGNFNRDYFGSSLTNTFGAGRVDWSGNFRKGGDANAYVTVSALDRNESFSVTGEIGTTERWYLPWKFLDYYGRFHAMVDINNEPTGLGSWLRGIKDSTMSGAAGAFLNQSLAIDLLPVKGLFDLQLHPFLDAGIVAPASRDFNASSDLRFGAGADIALFLDAISNFLIRCTVGMDLGYAAPWDHLEIILNTGLSF